MSYDIVITIHRNTVATDISLAKMVLDRTWRNSTGIVLLLMNVVETNSKKVSERANSNKNVGISIERLVCNNSANCLSLSRCHKL